MFLEKFNFYWQEVQAQILKDIEITLNLSKEYSLTLCEGKNSFCRKKVEIYEKLRNQDSTFNSYSTFNPKDKDFVQT